MYFSDLPKFQSVLGNISCTSVYGGCYYAQQTTVVDWFQAEAYCQSIGGNLAKVDNETMLNDLSSYFLSGTLANKVWIDLVRTQWRWTTSKKLHFLQIQ